MGAISQLIIYLRWPVMVGMVLALTVLVLFPNVRPTPGVDLQRDSGSLTPSDMEAWQGPVSYARAVARAAPAVVNIYTLKQVRNSRHPLFDDPLYRHFFNLSDIPRQQRMQSARGSGVIVSKEGYILTSNHVIDGVDEIVVSLADGREAKAQLKGVNRSSDLAVLKIDLDHLSPIPIGSPDTAMVGDVVLAIGNAFGMGQTVTQGIVSATRRRGFNIAHFENFIQTDAAINPGNSGGALIDAHGNLLGINTAILDQSGSASGIGFAIPADTAIQTLNDIVEFGRVVRGWLGVEAQPLSPQLAQSFNLRTTNGVLITRVAKQGPADKAGLRPGDVITRINDSLVGDGRWGQQEVAESRPGETVSIEIIRQGQVQVVEAVLGSEPIAS
ncbi:S1C family serine protease [Teredinibacter turnerae]|uniref:Serine peptidase DegP n=1 Tax=Teredinibacter turnerae (strain ATCC 39867 / T7901) TaxID=377629 RepID=C5BS69_TERTT|nr:trypsin-like peptidase domain-containing protein [Teredinibacter turnerae]ACR11655.1 putative serine peptidase DegP [Teredinibacter turnerae T7901]